ncbi:MAG: hypothetical protein M1817_002517 [Caeruleum heppii]|nr:MAG: hypothetical protein M1817_002517 [Caeruleum heppii]
MSLFRLQAVTHALGEDPYHQPSLVDPDGRLPHRVNLKLVTQTLPDEKGIRQVLGEVMLTVVCFATGAVSQMQEMRESRARDVGHPR